MPQKFIIPDDDSGDDPPILAKPKSKGFLENLSDSASKFLDEHPTIHRMVSGPLPEDQAADRTKILASLSDDEKTHAAAFEAKGGKVGQVVGPPTGDSLLPEAVHNKNEGMLQYGAKGLYNQLVRPIASPSGMLGVMSPGGKLADVAPVAEQAATEVAPKVIPKALPPAPPDIEAALSNPAPKPSFIAGPGGVAKNIPHQVDLGPINPSLGATDKGTILSRELGEVNNVSPDLLAGTPPKIGHVETPAESVQNALTPNRYKSKLQNLAAVEQPKGDFYPGAEKLPEQLPSAQPKELTGQSSLISDKPLEDVGPKVEDIEPPPVLSSKTPTEAVQRWGWGRNAGRFSANEVKEQFADLADKPEAVGAFQQGDRTGALKGVADYFDNRFSQLVKAGVLDPEQYKQNYLKQLWENDPEEVNAVFNKSGVAKTPGLSKESVFKSYQQGINAGLTPKYNNIADIAGAFEKEFTNAIRDKELYDYFQKNGMLASDAKLSSPFDWKLKGEGTKEAAGMMQNYFSKSPEGLNKVANVVTSTKNLALTQGLPYRTGQVSAHGFNVLQSDIMAQGFKKGLGDFFKGSVNPGTDVQFMKENSGITKKLIENGMNWADIEDHSALSKDKVSTLIDQIPGVGDANVLRRKMFEDPLFRVHLPATKLRIALDRYAQLLPKVGEESALKGAASYANDFAGGVDKTFRNKTYQDIARIGLLAPDWLESRLNIAKGLVTGKEGYVKAGARGAALASLPVGTGIAAKGLSGYLNSKPSESTGIEAGSVDGKNRNIEPLGTSVEPQRAALQVGTQLSQGNLQFPARYLGNKLSPPIQTMMNLKDNVDPFGNPLSGKDRFGRPISGAQAATNIGQEITRPMTPNVIESLIDYYRGKAGPEEVGAKSLGLPISYTTVPKGKKTSSGLSRLK